MGRKLQIKRGLQADIPILSEGEFGLTTDQKKLYIGAPGGNVRLATEADISAVNVSLNGESLNINPDFKVWQRGNTFTLTKNTGTTSPNVFFADRWAIGLHKNTTVTITQIAQGVKITVNGLCEIHQINEDVEFDKIKGKTVMLDINVTKIEGITMHSSLQESGGNFKQYIMITNILTAGRYFKSGLIEKTPVSNTVRDYFSLEGNGSVEIEYLRHYLGDVATKFEPRPYAEELALCQRYLFSHGHYNYYQSTVYNGNNLYFLIPTPVTLRITPTISGLVAKIANRQAIPIDGFTFQYDKRDNGIMVVATKELHGLTEATLLIDENAIFSAEL